MAPVRIRILTSISSITPTTKRFLLSARILVQKLTLFLFKYERRLAKQYFI